MAGRRLRLSQPAISAQMKRLEAIVGGAVFDRSNGKFDLTPMGSLILFQAKKLLAANDQILAIGGGADTHAQPVRLGLSAFVVDQFLRDCPADFRQAGQVAITSDHSGVLAKGLLEGFLDLACLVNPPEDIGQELFGWMEKLVWVKSPDFKFGIGRPIPLIAWPAVRLDAAMIAAVENAGLAYSIVFRSSDQHACMQAVGSGIGLMALPLPRLTPPLVVAEEDYLPALNPIRAGVYVRETPVAARVSSLVESLKMLLPKDAETKNPATKDPMPKDPAQNDLAQKELETKDLATKEPAT